MTISGEDAKNYIAISLSDYMLVNRGELVEADESTGRVVWKDTPDTQKSATLGANAIKILPKYAR